MKLEKSPTALKRKKFLNVEKWNMPSFKLEKLGVAVVAKLDGYDVTAFLLKIVLFIFL